MGSLYLVDVAVVVGIGSEEMYIQYWVVEMNER